MSPDEKAAGHERFLMRMQAHGLVSQADVAVAIQPGRDLGDEGRSFSRSLKAAYEAGYYRKPMRLAVLFGRKRPAVLTVPRGHQWMQFGMAGYVKVGETDAWLERHGLDRSDFREILDS